MTMSCIEELDVPYPADENLTTLVPRVKSFTNQYVTKADGNSETDIKTLSALIFDDDGKFVDLRTGTTSVTINKSMLNSPANQGRLTSATIVMFANVSLDNIKDANGKSIRDSLSTLTLAKVDGYSCHFKEANTVITDLASFADGLPMTGRAEGVNLTPSRDQQGPVTVNLQILYAKINFSIGVENGSENTGSGMKFAMTGYSVHNASKVTALAEPEGATASDDYAYTSSGKTGSKSGTVNLDGTPLTFTFYVAESRYEHNSDLRGIYPDDDWLTSVPGEDVKGYNDETDKGRLNGVKYFYDDLIQQYKPKLAGLTSGKPGQGKATYVLLKGTYTDYRGTAWTVNYKVYLGKDNAVNFHVDRNSEYTNHITIKGIRNNDSHGNGDVWVDHRVNVSTTDPAGYVTITRETLIDAHIEVRPLRVKWDGDKYAGVRVYFPTDSISGNLLNWIGIERFTGSNCQESSTYCYADGKSTGKRRYFTTDLISELQTKGGQFGVSELENGKKFVYLQNGDCAWIYFDENTFTGNKRNGLRKAEILLEFVDSDGNKKAEEKYEVKQQGLKLVPDVNYNAECYEEYLHSYDSADKYNLSTTPADYTQQGLSWGLADRTISKDVIVSAAPLDGSNYGINIGLQQYVSERYDFYHKSDVPTGTYYWYHQNANDNWVTMTSETGLGFTKRATENDAISIKDMGSLPENAYQYCLSKNKFEVDEDGNVAMVLHWYLPDVYQVKHMLEKIEDGFSDLHSEDFYWSSQPSFTRQGIDISLINQSIGVINEVPEKARARSKTGGVVDTLRTVQNRIRCLYSKDGTATDMTGRTPDGVGGLTTVIMKGYIDNLKSEFGYFKNSVKNLPAPPDSDTTATFPDSNYPTKKNSYNVSGAEFTYKVTSAKDSNGNIIEGFEVDPSMQSNWEEYIIPVVQTKTGYYHTLRTYPGLTRYTLDSLITTDGTYAYKPTSTEKSVVATETNKSSRILTKDLPSSTNLDHFDHLRSGDKLNISFAKSDGGKNPTYLYDELVSGTTNECTYKWSVPVYTPVENKNESQEYTLAESGYDYKSESEAKTAGEAAAKKFTGYSQITVTTDSQWQIFRTRYKYIIKGTTYKKYYKQTSGGEWYLASSTGAKPMSAGINTDELRMYSGNSFTISLSDATDEDGLKYSEAYEITKVKIYFSGDNMLKEPSLSLTNFDLNTVYARFVDDSIYSQLGSNGITGDESAHITGMDYNDDLKTQQWAGSGRSSVTLTLVDFILDPEVNMSITDILANLGDFDFSNPLATFANYTYRYKKAATATDKYLVIDKIEVKCTKKAAASE